MTNTNGIILSFALTCKQSFLNIERCCEIIKEKHIDLSKIPILLISTRADLYMDFEIYSEEVIEYCKMKNFIGYFEVSSISGNNTEEAFDFMANCVYQINILNKKLTDIEFKISLI